MLGEPRQRGQFGFGRIIVCITRKCLASERHALTYNHSKNTDK